MVRTAAWAALIGPGLKLSLQFSIMSASLALLLLLSFWIIRVISQAISPDRQAAALPVLGVSVILATIFMGGGPGLGLPITHGIIQAHGGPIRVASAGYDKIACPGSAFHVILPLAGDAGAFPPNVSQPR